MSERKTIHRVFWEWDFEKEERWLNEMAMNGWALEKAYFATYIFAPCEPGEYIFRMEMNSNKDYRSFVEGLGAEYVGSCVTWMYFRRKAELGAFDLFSDIDSRIAHLDRIGKTTWLLCLANLLIGVSNLLGGGRFPSSICCVPHCCPMALDASTARRKAWKVSAFCTNDFVKPFCATTA